MLTFLRKIISPDNPMRLLWHWLKGVTAAVVYGFPARKMVCIGVTGTNGKTTTTHMIESILRAAGKKVAMMSTSDFAILGKFDKNLSKKTTLSPFAVQRFLRQCVKASVDYVVIESSSHALHQSRLWGIPFRIAVLTNITHEHLDYHRTMKKYKEAKKILFLAVRRTCQRRPSQSIKIPHREAMVLNTADTFFEEFNKIACPLKIAYGLEKGDLSAHHPSYSKDGSAFALKYGEKTVDVALKIPGAFNVENALAATGAALACGLNLADAKKGLESFAGVPGRMETIKSPKGFEVLIDFALTPDALERLYKTLRPSHHGRIIGIIGSCGDRDKEKRPLMGEIVAKQTDLTIVTDEEPYSENPTTIMEAVLEGAKKVKPLGDHLMLIPDRKKAIEFAVQNAQKGDLVVLTGMGNLPTRTLNTGPIPWNERAVVEEVMRKL